MNADTFTYEPRGQMLVIHLPRELDHHNCRNLKYETDLLLAENYITRLVFDFSDTCFMDSSGIGVLAGRYRKISCFGGKVYVIHADERIRKILQMSGLTDLVEIME